MGDRPDRPTGRPAGRWQQTYPGQSRSPAPPGPTQPAVSDCYVSPVEGAPPREPSRAQVGRGPPDSAHRPPPRGRFRGCGRLRRRHPQEVLVARQAGDRASPRARGHPWTSRASPARADPRRSHAHRAQTPPGQAGRASGNSEALRIDERHRGCTGWRRAGIPTTARGWLGSLRRYAACRRTAACLTAGARASGAARRARADAGLGGIPRLGAVPRLERGAARRQHSGAASRGPERAQLPARRFRQPGWPHQGRGRRPGPRHRGCRPTHRHDHARPPVRTRPATRRRVHPPGLLCEYPRQGPEQDQRGLLPRRGQTAHQHRRTGHRHSRRRLPRGWLRRLRRHRRQHRRCRGLRAVRDEGRLLGS